MNKLTNIMDDSVYLARDYGSIITWFVKKLKYLTQDWTDLSVSEPDTMSLSYIAYIFDLLNYLVDKKFINTIFDKTTSVQFLSYLYKLVGSELNDYNSGMITANVTNLSSEPMIIDKFSIVRMKEFHNELFTVIQDYEIPGKSDTDIKLVRGTPIYYNCNKCDMINGYFLLPHKNINRNLITLLIDGTYEIPKTDDAIFDLTSSFEVKQYGEYQTSIRLSPSANRQTKSSVIVIYNLNDDYLIAENSELVFLKSENPNYQMRTTSTNKVDSIDINDMKLMYYEILSKINVLYNCEYDTSQLISDRVDYINFNYRNNSIFRTGFIDYDTGKLSVYLVSNTKDGVAYVTYKCVNSSGTRVIKSKEIELISNAEIVLEVASGFSIEPMSVFVKYDNEIINDSNGLSELTLVNGETSLVFNYSTTDDNPITSLLNEGFVNYTDPSISIVFNYIPSTNLIISYKVKTLKTEISKKEYIKVNDLSLYQILDINPGESLVVNSLIITNGNNILRDNNGVLLEDQSDEDILRNNISSKILVNRTSDNIVLNKLLVKPLNVKATVYLYRSDVSTSDILRDIKNSLNNAYYKGSHEPGVTVKRLPILLAIESSNPTIKYATLESPSLDVSVDSNQIIELGSIDIVFERSDE